MSSRHPNSRAILALLQRFRLQVLLLTLSSSISLMGIACSPPLGTSQAAQGSSPQQESSVTPTPFPPPGDPPPANIPPAQVTVIPRPPGPTPTPVGPVPTSTPIPSTAPLQVVVESLDPPSSPELIREMARHANLVVIGTILDVGTSRWTTPTGQRPDSPHVGISRPDNPRPNIFTPIQLQVDTYLKGQDARPILTVTAPGGQVGQDYVRFRYAIDRTPGQRIVAFLQTQAADRLPTDMPSGVYSMGRGRYIVQNDVVIDAYDPSWTMSLSEFVNLVTNAE